MWVFEKAYVEREASGGEGVEQKVSQKEEGACGELLTMAFSKTYISLESWWKRHWERTKQWKRHHWPGQSFYQRSDSLLLPSQCYLVWLSTPRKLYEESHIFCKSFALPETGPRVSINYSVFSVQQLGGTTQLKQGSCNRANNETKLYPDLLIRRRRERQSFEFILDSVTESSPA